MALRRKGQDFKVRCELEATQKPQRFFSLIKELKRVDVYPELIHILYIYIINNNKYNIIKINNAYYF